MPSFGSVIRKSLALKRSPSNSSAISTSSERKSSFSSGPGTPVAPSPSKQDATNFLHLVNEARAQANLPPFSLDPALMVGTEEHTQNMINQGKLGGADPKGRSLRERYTSVGVSPRRMIQENVIGGPADVEACFRLLFKNDACRRHILSAKLTCIGFTRMSPRPVSGAKTSSKPFYTIAYADGIPEASVLQNETIPGESSSLDSVPSPITPVSPTTSCESTDGPPTPKAVPISRGNSRGSAGAAMAKKRWSGLVHAVGAFAGKISRDSSKEVGTTMNFLALVNNARSKASVPPMTFDRNLQQGAKDQATHLALAATTTTPPAKALRERYTAVGVSTKRTIRENVICGPKTPEDCFNALYGNASCKANILSPELRRCGFAQVSTKDNQMHYVVAYSDPGPQYAFDAENMIHLVNLERKKKGLHPVLCDPYLEQAAKNHSDDMAECQHMSHDDPRGRSLLERFTDAGVTMRRKVLENVAFGERDEVECMEKLMKSKDHRKNILDPEVTRIGCAVSHCHEGTPYYTQAFGWDGKKPSESGKPDPCINPNREASTFLDLANTMRAKHCRKGSPFTLDSALTRGAQAHAEYQASLGKLSGENAKGQGLRERYVAAGVPSGWGIDENVIGGPETTQAVCEVLGKDKGNSNLYRPELTRIGYGVAKSKETGLYFYAIAFAEPGESEEEVAKSFDPQIVLKLVNDHRKKKGLTPLIAEPSLVHVAQSRAEIMAESSSLNAPDPKDRDLLNRFKDSGVPTSLSRRLMENVGAGAGSASDCITSFMESKPHKANILHAQVSHFGSGAAVDAEGTPYYVHAFGWNGE
ncbi:hypothetical protein BJ684DRAFT_20134 [Piptocephalis cylindrospora]|uniref:SCP domain-containing protein n=1 Tax=Piptocephalis cylindrospora TaxID=1907219 RepID=A0A4P9Y3E0_9FUNG|nr:hypothetical protein BJ684DRAFT_20134 [Piptocephalis cylindrospora]|eukprot:RKP13375.1 hypothetical protein BJ684DRAFT_20134 [Piptocephalis cylindrospora]